MFILFGNAAGFGIWKVLDEKKLQETNNLEQLFETNQEANNFIQLQGFRKFSNSAEALKAGIAISEGKLCSSLNKLLRKIYKNGVKDQLLVDEGKLGNAIKKKFDINVTTGGHLNKLIRCIGLKFEPLYPELGGKELAAMRLRMGLNMSRYKLKYPPDKVDSMVIHSVILMKQLDKEINNYTVKLRDWYGCHFPELSLHIPDNKSYIKAVLAIGDRENAGFANLTDFLEEAIILRIQHCAKFSIGTEINKKDFHSIFLLCRQIQDLLSYRPVLNDYLSNLMVNIAPNLTTITGELLGAQLITLAGSLSKLGKMPSSTILLLGAGRSLFRALKYREATPTCGIIYRSPLVTNTSEKFKGAMARKVATKAALAVRCDALGDNPLESIEFFKVVKTKLYDSLKKLEDKYTRKLSSRGRRELKFDSYKRKSDVQKYKNNKSDEAIGSHIKNESKGKGNNPNKFKVEIDYKENKTITKIVKVENAKPTEIKKNLRKNKKKNQKDALSN